MNCGECRDLGITLLEHVDPEIHTVASATTISHSGNSRPWQSIGSLCIYVRPAPAQADGRTDGRKGGRAEGADGCKGRFERGYNDFHRVAQETSKITDVFDVL